MTEAEMYLRLMNSVAEHRSEKLAKTFRIEMLTLFIEDPPKGATSEDVKVIRQELEKLKQEK